MELIGRPVTTTERIAINSDETLFEQANKGLLAEQSLEDYLKTGNIDANELERIHGIINDGREAAWKVAWANQGLARKVAKAASSNIRHNGAFDEEDLFMVGLEGAFEAARRYDGRARFSTYAMYGIRRKVYGFIDDASSTVRIPRHQQVKIRKHDRAISNYYQVHGCYPSRELLAKIMNVAPWEIDDLSKVRLLSKEMGSIDTGYSPQIDDPSDEGYGKIMKPIVGDEQKPTDEESLDSVRRLDIQDWIKKFGLSDREKRIISLRFGLDDGEPKTLEETASLVGVTRERIRQILSKAFAKMRSPYGNPLIEPEFSSYAQEVLVPTDQIDKFGRRVLRRELRVITVQHLFVE